MNALHRFTLALSKSLVILAGLLLVAMMVLACANMVLRAVWLPLKGTYELLGFLGALSTALGLAYTQIHKGHIALTILVGIFPRRVERFIDLFGSILSAAFFAVVGWRGFAWATRLMDSGELSETLRFAYYPVVMVMAFGILVLALVLVDDFVQLLTARPAEGRR